MKFKLLLHTLWLTAFSIPILKAQHVIVQGIVMDNNNQTIPGVNVFFPQSNQGTVTDSEGGFTREIPRRDTISIIYSHIQYTTLNQKYTVLPGQERVEINVTLDIETKILEGVSVTDRLEDDLAREKVSVYKINPKSAAVLPSPFGDFNKILTTLPGVVSNNELSSTYSVRGGNFDENLVYINGIQVYRPFLIRAGQQEGLSIVNPDLVQSVEFSAGGWQPKYGDKLSSSLNIQYKNPEEFAASITASLLGGTAHVEGVSNNNRLNYIAGIRHKRAAYLLGTQEIQGGYRPKFTDVQTYVSYDLSRNYDQSTTINGFISYAKNEFFVTPESSETNFGNFDLSLRLLVGFDGTETLSYDLWQGGIILKHRIKEHFMTDFIISGMYSTEREYFDVEGGYLLCDVNNKPGTPDFNECVSARGLGTNYDYGRNKLEAQVMTLESRNIIFLENDHQVEFGVAYSYQNMDDVIDEYSFIDSADYVTINHKLNSSLALKANHVTGYIQHGLTLGTIHRITYGVRLNYRDVNSQLIVSPRFQYSVHPLWNKDIVLRAAIGVYQQPPFYRELRDFEGALHPQLKAQRAMHFIAGLDYDFKLWGRNFKFISEAYYKHLSNVIAYDVDNVKIRYYANNESKAFATGLDLRVSGEFIPGAESWFSLGLLNTKEDLASDNRDFVRRPSDQHINFAIFFQDHIPNDPSIRVNLNLLFGSGLPFGPPNDLDTRNIFIGRAYRRVDVGFSKIISFNDKWLQSLWFGVNILNILGANNTISYTWVPDFSGIEWGVPNNLSQRFFNVKIQAQF